MFHILLLLPFLNVKNERQALVRLVVTDLKHIDTQDSSIQRLGRLS
jgi:hypothetical protein